MPITLALVIVAASVSLSSSEPFVFGPVQQRGGGAAGRRGDGATGQRRIGGAAADGRARPYPGPRERVSLLQPVKSGETGISRSRRFSAGGDGEPPLSGYL